jgi:soluble lytic murein transglycosylase-like protein
MNMQSLAYSLVVFLICASAHADIFAFVDENGVTHYSNVPSDDRYESILRSATDKNGSPIHPKLLKLSVQFDPFIRDAAREADVDPELLRAVIVVESGFDARAVSHAGAQGLMQLMPATAATYGVSDVFDPQDNIRGGARYLRALLDRYDQNYELVLAAYNAGEKAVEKYGNKIPPFAETQKYVPKVMRLYNKLSQLSRSG